jgi:eukaryotic-like serine/threonine-protein kinase
LTHLIGKQLGRYTIQAEIGRGGMARVYRAQDTQLKRIVAIKVLLPQLAVDPEFAQRFEREAVTAANLRHPNIVTIYDVGEQDSLRYIAMEYVRGHTLHAIIEDRGALGLGYAITIVGPVAAALDYAHRQGAVHRDIKPQNIMIDVDGRVLLTDFGIAQAPEGGSTGGERLTRTGIFMGTPEYISPEQASAQRVDGRSDLYSLGIATYEVITGNVPFSGATPQLIVAHAQTQPPPISTQDQDLPPELDVVMARILAKRPDQRFATGAAFIDELRGVARKYGLAVASPRQLAVLVPSAASAADSTIARSREPAPPAANPPPPAPRLGSSDPTQVGPTPPRPAAPTMPSRARPAVQPPVEPREEYADESERAPTGVSRRRSAPEPPDNDGGRRMAMVIGGLFGGLLLVILFVIVNRPFAGAGSDVTPTRPPLASTIPVRVPTATPTISPTPAPTVAPTAQPIQATALPEPPPTAEPVATPAPPPPDTPIPLPPDTPIPDLPTDVPTPAVEPSATASLTPEQPTPDTTSTAPPTVTIEEPPSPSPETTATATVSPVTTAPATATAITPLATSAATVAATAVPTIEPPTPTQTAPTSVAPTDQPAPQPPIATP